MKVNTEEGKGKLYIRFEPDTMYEAYQLGMITGTDKIDAITESIPAKQELVSVKFTLLDLAYALQGKHCEFKD